MLNLAAGEARYGSPEVARSHLGDAGTDRSAGAVAWDGQERSAPNVHAGLLESL